MIFTKTVFIVGAGASQPYEFPTGSELLHKVVNILGGTDGISALNQCCGFSEAQIEDFRIALRHSGHTSVDAFLEHRVDLIEIGKAAMALVLIRCENGIGILFNETDKTWLRYLYGRMNSKFEDFNLNKVAFLTFNYDRILEQFLFTSLSNSHRKPDEECRTQMESIPIIHLHGNLGNHPWQTPKVSTTKARPFDPTVNKETIDIARAGIKIVHEAMSSGGDEDFEAAKSLLHEAEQIIFLGFGYNGTNMDRLDLKSTSVKAFGTGLGMSKQEKYLGETISKRSIDITSFDCINLLRNYDW